MSLPFIFNFGAMLTDCLGYRSCMIIHLCIIPDQMHFIFIIRPIMIISHKIEKKGREERKITSSKDARAQNQGRKLAIQILSKRQKKRDRVDIGCNVEDP